MIVTTLDGDEVDEDGDEDRANRDDFPREEEEAILNDEQIVLSTVPKSDDHMLIVPTAPADNSGRVIVETEPNPSDKERR